MVLVVGATGVLGRRVCRALAREGTPTRAMTRSPKRAAELLDPSIDIIAGDLRDPRSIETAVAGCDAVIDCAAGRPTRGDRNNDAHAVDDRGTALLVRIAREAGIKRIVYVSALGASPSAPLRWLRMKYRAEWHVLHSGMHFTILRPAALAETWLVPLADRVHAGKSVWLPGRALDPVSWVAADDVARLAVLSLNDPDLEDRTIDVGGPTPITVEEALEAMEASAQQRVVRIHVPPAMMRFAAAVVGPIDPAWAYRLRFGWCIARHPQICESAGLQRMVPEWRPSPVDVIAGDMARA